MHVASLIHTIIKIEYVFAAVLVALFYEHVGHFDWWWLIILFPLFDISMIGYLINPRIGAITYNIVHSFVGPALLTIAYILTTGQAAADTTRGTSTDSILLFAILVWIFHLCVDRALGFGLKHGTGFHHTHLGGVGKEHKKTV